MKCPVEFGYFAASLPTTMCVALCVAVRVKVRVAVRVAVPPVLQCVL